MTTMRKPVGAVSVALALMIATPSASEICEVDHAAAATLLIPYFSVDVALCDGTQSNTLIRVRNTNSSESALTQVRLWSNVGSSLATFNMLLQPGGEEILDLQALFCDGTIPDTRPKSAPRHSLEGCILAGTYDEESLRNIIAWYTGDEAFGKCHAYFTDIFAQGYITIDHVDGCSSLFPDDTGYFADDGSGVANNVNQLWGDWSIIENGRATGDNLVSVEAEAERGSNFVPGNPTFYGRYVNGSALDQREPLATAWSARYGTGLGDTALFVWRDSEGAIKKNVPCGSTPRAGFAPTATLPPVPVTFTSTTGETTSTTIDLPLAINRINLSEHPENPYSEGTALLDLSMGDGSQSFVIAVEVSADGVLTDLGAEPLNIECSKVVPLFSDGFESGDTSAWSSSAP